MPDLPICQHLFFPCQMNHLNEELAEKIWPSNAGGEKKLFIHVHKVHMFMFKEDEGLRQNLKLPQANSSYVHEKASSSFNININIWTLSTCIHCLQFTGKHQ